MANKPDSRIPTPYMHKKRIPLTKAFIYLNVATAEGNKRAYFYVKALTHRTASVEVTDEKGITVAIRVPLTEGSFERTFGNRRSGTFVEYSGPASFQS